MEYILSKTQKGVYIEVSKHKESSIASLSQSTSVHRPQLYKILGDLIKMGLVSKNKLGKRYVYAVTGRENLELLIEASIEKTKQEARRIIQESFDAPSVTYIKNKQDIMNMYRDLVETLGTQEIYYSFTTTSLTREQLEQYFPVNFRRIRESKNLWSYLIAQNPMKGKERFTLEIRKTDWGELEKNCVWMVYGTKFAFIDFSTEKGVLVNNAKLSLFQQGILKRIFQISPPKTATV